MVAATCEKLLPYAQACSNPSCHHDTPPIQKGTILITLVYYLIFFYCDSGLRTIILGRTPDFAHVIVLQLS